MSIPITPETKVGALLDAYPGIEEVLIRLAPQFEKLRNPVLRKTVAKVATLEQAAKIGGLPVRELVRALRQATGQAGPEVAGDFPIVTGEDAPDWLSQSSMKHDIDGDSMLERGVHPIGQIREYASGLNPGEMIRLTTSFRPEPLIETMRRGGLKVFSRQERPGLHSTWFAR